jgi:hypothetical protein
MFGMGLTISAEDFRVVFSRPRDVLIGCMAQYTVMPLAAWAISVGLGLPKELAIGVILVGCCPGGTASNVITYLAKGDLALSVGMTAVSTLIAPVMTPLLVLALAGTMVEVDTIGMLLSIFDNHKQPLYTTQVKKGAGHNDFGDPVTVYAADSSLLGNNPYIKPVAVLIDRGSYSATSFFSVCTQGYDNVKLFGDYTGGGLGLPNGGMLPNGWTYRFSTSRTLDMAGHNYENGVPPDERVILDPVATALGLDNVIETAADWIMQ